MKRSVGAWWLLLVWLLLVRVVGGPAVGCGGSSQRQAQGAAGVAVVGSPPVAKRIAHHVVQHGATRRDDYHWMRADRDAALAYLKAENAYTAQVMAPTEAMQERIFQEIKSRIVETDMEVPVFDRGYHYYTRTVEGAQYPLHCRKQGTLDAPEQVLLDLNAMADGHEFMGLGAFEVSDDGQRLAYSTDTTGFRAYTLYVKDLRTGADLGVRIENTKSVAWAADNRTLFYVVDDTAKRPYRLMRRVVGDADGTLVHEERDERFALHVDRSRDGALIFVGSHSHTTSEVGFIRATDPTAAITMVSARVEGREYDVDHGNGQLYLRVNDTSRNFRLVTAPLSQPAQWTEHIAASDDVMLEDVDVFSSHVVVSERVGGLPRLRVLPRGGQAITIPVDEAVYDLWGGDNPDFHAGFVRYEYMSMATPRSVIDFDVQSSTRTLRKQVEVRGDYDPTRYVSERIHATAADGTQIPISIVHRRDVPRDGTAPMWLTGYGAYGYPYPITFSHARLSLLDRGVVYAIAHVRGGGELGKRWHDHGRMEHKPNTFTDFVAVAEHLVAEGYTRTSRLVIDGGSAGGLLMGAVTNMRPELFGAVIADVPFVDVLNTMSDATLLLTVGEYEEWGNPNVPEQFAWIAAYCPYSNIRAQAYPPMLVKTSWNDSQVMYWEAAKYVARLRATKTNRAPLILQTNLGGGHGGSSGRYDRYREVAFDYAFALWRMGIPE